jgi:hypothetical protein
VDSLQTIYAIVIGLAITNSINTIFLDNGKLVELSSIVKYFAPFLAFVFIVVPFFHGMNRHLDQCYLDKEANHIEGALLFDFIVFFAEAMLLFAFAGSLKTPGLKWAVVLLFLLSFDSVWAFVSSLVHYRKFYGPTLWVIINIITCAVILFIMHNNCIDAKAKPFLLCIIIFLRAIIDYTLCWRFYFPKNTQQRQA